VVVVGVGSVSDLMKTIDDDNALSASGDRPPLNVSARWDLFSVGMCLAMT
jgi:hypothetical protein